MGTTIPGDERMLRNALVLLMLVLIIQGCKPSKDWIAETTRQSIEETLRKDESFKDYEVAVQSVTVVQESDGKYQGLVKITLDNKEYTFPVVIIADRDNAIWRTEAGALSFLAQHEIAKALEPKERKEDVERTSIHQWGVQVASTTDKKYMEHVVKALEQAGYKTYVHTVKERSRIYVGPYSERATAEWARDQLQRQQKLNGFVIIYEEPKSGYQLLQEQ